MTQNNENYGLVLKIRLRFSRFCFVFPPENEPTGPRRGVLARYRKLVSSRGELRQIGCDLKHRQTISNLRRSRECGQARRPTAVAQQFDSVDSRVAAEWQIDQQARHAGARQSLQLARSRCISLSTANGRCLHVEDSR